MPHYKGIKVLKSIQRMDAKMVKGLERKMYVDVKGLEEQLKSLCSV